MKIFISIGVICCCIATALQLPGQVLLTEMTISKLGEGVASVTNTLNLTFGLSPEPGHQVALMLFKDLWVTSEDAGHVYTQGPNDDPADFNLYTSYLTDSKVSYCNYLETVGPGGSGEAGAPETQFFDYLPPGNNGVDLGGFAIDYYTLVFNTLSFTSPGSDPNHDGNWTDYSFSATFSVYGEPIPEPRSLSLLVCTAIIILLRRATRRRARHLGTFCAQLNTLSLLTL